MKRNSCQGFKAKFIYEALYGVIILFVFALITINAYSIYNDLNNEIQNSNDISNSSKLHSATQFARFDDTTDGLVILISIFLLIVFLALAYFSYDSPIVLIVLIVLLIAMLVIAAILSNTWTDYTADAEFATLATNLPITNNIMNNFLIYVLIILVACGTVLFMRAKG